MSREIACSPNTAIFVPGTEIVTPLASRVLFWHPRYLADSPALHFIPFLFWLTDVLRPKSIVHLGLGSGVTYFASCQAVDKLNLDARCYGFSPKTSKKIRAYNTKNYDAFSTLSARNPQTSARSFPDGTIDLLHISVDMKVEKLDIVLHRWLPKISQGGIAVLTGETISLESKELDQLIESKQETYPWFKVEAGNGLLILMCGDNMDERLAGLSKLRVGAPGYGVVHQVFNRLGATIVSEFRARSSANKMKKLKRSLKTTKHDLAKKSEGSTKTKASKKLKAETRAHEKSKRRLLKRESQLESHQKGFDSAAIEIENLNTKLELLKEAEQAETPIDEAGHFEGRPSSWGRDLEVLTEALEKQAIIATEQAEQSSKKYDSQLKSQRIAIEQDRVVLQNVYQERDAALQSRAEMAKAVDGMLNSTSWRLTSPVRKILNTVRGKA